MRIVAVIVLVAATGLLTGCGGGAASAPPGSADNPLVGKHQEQTVAGRSNEAKAQGNVKPGYEQLVAGQESKPQSRFSPCNLVTRAQARAIVGGQVLAPVEGPQGPTCIYRTGKRSMVTLAVQTQDFRGLRKHVYRPQSLIVGDRPAYCGTYGQPTLYVSLTKDRVLSIAAPCSVARRFATAAVARLGG
jgi:hypothetical protein